MNYCAYRIKNEVQHWINKKCSEQPKLQLILNKKIIIEKIIYIKKKLVKQFFLILHSYLGSGNWRHSQNLPAHSN